MTEITKERAGKHSDAGAAAAGEPSKPGFPLVRLDRMMESLRHAEYDINSGVGELVDNSVESGAHNVWVEYDQEEKAFGKRSLKVVSELAVIDDGVAPCDVMVDVTGTGWRLEDGVESGGDFASLAAFLRGRRTTA